MPSSVRQDELSPHRRTAAEVLEALGSDARAGLSTVEARARLARHGPNALPSAPRTPAWRRFLAQFGDVLTLLLLVATAVSLAAWWIERESPLPYEALTILAIVILNGVLGYLQERRAEQALAALEAMSAPVARVLRDGVQATVPTNDVVPGDVLLLEEGDTVPADGRVLEAVALRTAEAALTGESAPAVKQRAPVDGEPAIGDRASMIFLGTAVAAGRGRAVVTATGVDTELGRIAASLQRAEEPPTPLQRELDRTGRRLGLAVVAIAAVIAAAILLLGGAHSAGELLDVLLLAVSLAVAAVPEGLTAITTIVLSLGTQRMAARHVIVRRLTAVETLGSTTTICSDKTGTLTRNEMTVRAVITASGRVELTGAGYEPHGELRQDGGAVRDRVLLTEVEELLGASSLASNATVALRDGQWTVQGDPTEGALLVAARKVGQALDALQRRFPRVGEVPFSAERKLMSTAHADLEHGDRTLVLSKGAPDVLLERCAEERVAGGTRPLTPARRAEIARSVEQLAAGALRTLGVAYRTIPPGAPAASEEVEQALVLLGVVGMIDPPRPEAAAAVAHARRAGVRPILITGDHPITAAAIAAELGIAAPGERTLTGAALQRLDDAALRSAVREVSVYARVAPEHKLRIVRALQANGQVTAMTGDGVNDAPALEAADIGVAMGRAGTDVAKGAADMVLTDDDFASIVAAIEEGRAIFANIQRFLRYLLSSNAGEVLVMFLGVVLARAIGLAPEGGPGVVVPLLATQILWINLLTDAGPALALGVEPPAQDVMRRPPRHPGRPVLAGRDWLDVLLVGLIMAAATLLVMDGALPGGLIPGAPAPGGMTRARTLGFTTLVLAQLFNAFSARSSRRSAFHRLLGNRWLWLAALISVALQVAVVHAPPLQRPFGTVALSARDWLRCTAAASAVLWAMELRKLAGRVRRGPVQGPPGPAISSGADGTQHAP